ncbi:GDP-mannose 4,6-dehydratase [Halobacterium sp. GSL-19]|nr:GDP-mannose 4,6-dehydratase [Halobacterium salinarum]MCF2240721.1 GDP-mannose 4,6-dehydratase [Halobacterium salinarum]QRY23792.1 GDP-mannose 4,6-dehydratase [Halobacterium sp. GSL-19]
MTGGLGFIGSHLSEALVERGDRVVALDNLSTGRRENVSSLGESGRFEIIEGDVRDHIADQLDAAGVDPGSVARCYHLASRASPTDFDEHSLDIATTNSNGTKSVLEFASKYNVRVVYASTSEVYGEPEVHPQPEDYTGNVDIRGKRSCYDESKRLGETYCEIYHRKHDVDVRTARIFNTYGPQMRVDDGRVIPTFLRQAIKGRDLTVYGDGTQTRSFVYITDQIRALMRLMDEDGIENCVVNLGSRDEITINELAAVVAETATGDIDVTHDQLPEGDPSRRRPDISRARSMLGWSPTVDLQQGLSRTIDSIHEELNN